MAQTSKDLLQGPEHNFPGQRVQPSKGHGPVKVCLRDIDPVHGDFQGMFTTVVEHPKHRMYLVTQCFERGNARNGACKIGLTESQVLAQLFHRTTQYLGTVQVVLKPTTAGY